MIAAVLAVSGVGAGVVSAVASGSGASGRCIPTVLVIGVGKDTSPSASAALAAAERREPHTLFATAPMPTPPHGRWVVDPKQSDRLHQRFTHLSTGRLDWVVDVSGPGITTRLHDGFFITGRINRRLNFVVP